MHNTVGLQGATDCQSWVADPCVGPNLLNALNVFVSPVAVVSITFRCPLETLPISFPLFAVHFCICCKFLYLLRSFSNVLCCVVLWTLMKIISDLACLLTTWMILLPLYRPAHWTYTVDEVWGHRRSDYHHQLHCWKFPKVNSHLDEDRQHWSSVFKNHWK